MLFGILAMESMGEQDLPEVHAYIVHPFRTSPGAGYISVHTSPLRGGCRRKG